MNWILTAVLTVLVVEVALRLPFVAVMTRLARSTGKALRTVSSKAISDHWKEKALGAYARTTFVSSLKLAGLLAAVLAIAAILMVAFDRVSGGFQDMLLGWRGLTLSLVLASLYVTFARPRLHDRL